MSILNCICKNNEPPKIPEGMSEQLKDFVEKCLVFEPTKRFNVYQLKSIHFYQIVKVFQILKLLLIIVFIHKYKILFICKIIFFY